MTIYNQKTALQYLSQFLIKLFFFHNIAHANSCTEKKANKKKNKVLKRQIIDLSNTSESTEILLKRTLENIVMQLTNSLVQN